MKYLKGFGGGSIKDTVNRCIDALLTNSMQRLFNRTGAKGRLSFAAQLEPLVKTTVFTKTQYKDATTKDIETIVYNYLRNSRDRLGGRVKRIKSEAGNTTCVSDSAAVNPSDSDRESDDE
ncbi:MAG: hypothetical protein AAGK05_18535 [Pseudomonadota bacterium]